MSKPILAITMGDPGGIGPEVIVKSLRNFSPHKKCRLLLVGARPFFDYLANQHALDLPLHDLPLLDPSLVREEAINFLDVTEEARRLLGLRESGGDFPAGKNHGTPAFEYGKISAWNAALAFAAVKIAAYQAKAGLIQAIVTGPVSKAAIRLLDPGFQGHTEYFAEVSGAKNFAMMFVSSKLKVTLVTIHVPLKRVSALITKELVLEKIKLTAQFLKNYVKLSKPKLAVCALNPHGSETGPEEDALIAPAVKAAQKLGLDVSGPYAADRLFYDAYRGRFDALVSMYHDQALGPFKMIAFRDGVNVTLGLPFLRTSPDHGTAFDIAYQNKADASSFKAALARIEEWLPC